MRSRNRSFAAIGLGLCLGVAALALPASADPRDGRGWRNERHHDGDRDGRGEHWGHSDQGGWGHGEQGGWGHGDQGGWGHRGYRGWNNGGYGYVHQHGPGCGHGGGYAYQRWGGYGTRRPYGWYPFAGFFGR